MGRQKSATSHTTVGEAPQKEAKLAWKLESEKLLDTFKTMKKKKKKKIVNTKRDANETAALVWTVKLNVWYKVERW